MTNGWVDIKNADVILCMGGFMMFIGFMMIRKIVDIEV